MAVLLPVCDRSKLPDGDYESRNWGLTASVMDAVPSVIFTHVTTLQKEDKMSLTITKSIPELVNFQLNEMYKDKAMSWYCLLWDENSSWTDASISPLRVMRGQGWIGQKWRTDYNSCNSWRIRICQPRRLLESRVIWRSWGKVGKWNSGRLPHAITPQIRVQQVPLAAVCIGLLGLHKSMYMLHGVIKTEKQNKIVKVISELCWTTVHVCFKDRRIFQPQMHLIPTHPIFRGSAQCHSC